MSTVDDRPHFGLGHATRVDTLEVIWPDGRRQLLTGLDVDRVLTVKQGDAARAVSGAACQVSSCDPRHPTPDTRQLPFQLMDPRRTLLYRHEQGSFVDYDVQSLLPYMASRQGPPLAVADVDGDGLDDVFIGGAAGVPGKLFKQRKDGSFVESVHGQPWAADKEYEDWEPCSSTRTATGCRTCTSRA